MRRPKPRERWHENDVSGLVDLVDAMQADAGRPITRLRVDGGAARNDLLMQFQADMLEVTIDSPENV